MAGGGRGVVSRTSRAATEVVVGGGKSGGQFKEWQKWPKRGDQRLLGLQSEGRAMSATGDRNEIVLHGDTKFHFFYLYNRILY